MKLLRRRTKNTLYAVTAALVLIVFLWIYSETGSPPAFQASTQAQQQVQFYLKNSSSLQYAQNGELDSSLRSEYSSHQSADDSVLLREPRVNLYRDGELHWQVSAQSGVISEQGEKIDLQQRVLIISADQQTSLKTPQLFIYPGKKLADTNKPVTLNSLNGFTKAVGLQADLRKEHLSLLDNVRGQYEPEVLQ